MKIDTNKIIVTLKWLLLGFMIFVIILKSICFFYFESPEHFFYYVGYVKQISIYFLLIAIVTVREKWVWYIGFLYFIVASIDLTLWDIGSGVPRKICSGHSRFDFVQIIAWANFHFRNSEMWGINSLISIKRLNIIQHFAFPATALFFLSNYVRAYYGLSPILKSAKSRFFF
ncbi:MAG: hypothetical protein RL757_3099 [Bacteroidota bacterium]|jgi:hypothetical protein